MNGSTFSTEFVESNTPVEFGLLASADEFTLYQTFIMQHNPEKKVNLKMGTIFRLHNICLITNALWMKIPWIFGAKIQIKTNLTKKLWNVFFPRHIFFGAKIQINFLKKSWECFGFIWFWHENSNRAILKLKSFHVFWP